MLERLGAYLREQKDGALPRSQYGQAIAYALNQWDELLRYTEDGRLEIDNNTRRFPKSGGSSWVSIASPRVYL